MKNSLSCALVLLGVVTGLSAAPVGRERVRFDDGWKFHLNDSSTEEYSVPLVAGEAVKSWRWKPADNPATEAAEVTRGDYDDSKWSEVQTGRGLLTKSNSTAWFRAVLPPAKGPQPRLHFAGVDDVATVYLNGKQVAEHAGWDEAFDVKLDVGWQRDGKNVLVVLVRNFGGSGGIDPVYFESEEPRTTLAAERGPAAAHYDDHAWGNVQLPHDFVVEGTFDAKDDVSHGFLPKAAGWYRKTFTLPAEDRGKVLWLEFDGVYRNCIVWLNGRPLGKHASGYTSFYYDVSAQANYGGENVLTVWADARQKEGWWYEGGGIYRHVYLTKLAPSHVSHWGTKVVATPSNDFGKATVEVEVDVENEGGEKGNYRIENVITALPRWDGFAVAEEGVAVRDAASLARGNTSVVFNAGEGKKAWKATSLTFDRPALWSPDAPNLYQLETSLYRDDKIVDQVRTPFGVRSLRWDSDEGFFLNGKPFKIKGTCNHQDFAGVGVALPDRVHYYKVEKLKEMGSNAFRYSHQPMAPELLEACDRVGMVVMDENRKLGDSSEILGQVESLVRRDRNHASIIMWSMCNEEGAQGTEHGGRMFATMKETVLKWDRTRPITAAMNGGFGGGISLVGELQGFNYNTQAYDDFHAKFPLIPCYGSETASETTTRGIYADNKEKGYVSTHKTTAEMAWKPIAERAWMAGGFVWTGFDYRGEPTPYRWPCVNSHFGIMDTCGFPKDSYYYYQAEWGNKPVVHLSAQWNQEGKDGQEIPVWVTGNATKGELFLNGTSLGTKDLPAHLHAEWKVRYAPGTLELRGYDADGKQIASDKLETTGAPAAIKITPDRTGFRADREDVVLVTCAVVDAQGRIVPTASDEITFEVKGPAHVAGVGNGDPSDHDPDKASKRHAFNGRCLAIVQAEGQGGEVTIAVSAPGLKGATVSVQAR